jgi:uncharacterized protein YjbI with pentapeptide repeats
MSIKRFFWVSAIAIGALAGSGLFHQSAQAYSEADLAKLKNTKKCQNCDLIGADLSHTKLTGANLSGANLTGAKLYDTNLLGANLQGASLQGAEISNIDLSGPISRMPIFKGLPMNITQARCRVPI